MSRLPKPRQSHCTGSTMLETELDFIDPGESIDTGPASRDVKGSIGTVFAQQRSGHLIIICKPIVEGENERIIRIRQVLFPYFNHLIHADGAPYGTHFLQKSLKKLRINVLASVVEDPMVSFVCDPMQKKNSQCAGGQLANQVAYSVSVWRVKFRTHISFRAEGMYE